MTTYPMKLTCTKCGATDEGTLHIEDSKPLTDAEIKRIAAPLFMSHYWNLCNEFARAIEAAHGITGEQRGTEMNITLYSKSNCPLCVQAKQLLASKGLDYTEISLDEEARRANFISAYPDAKQMPQIFIGDQRIGGFAGLQAALKQLGI